MKYSKYKCRVCGIKMEQKDYPTRGWICSSCFHDYIAKVEQKKREEKNALKTCHVCGRKSQMDDDNGKPICFSCWRNKAAKVIAGMRKEGKIK